MPAANGANCDFGDEAIIARSRFRRLGHDRQAQGRSRICWSRARSPAPSGRSIRTTSGELVWSQKTRPRAARNGGIHWGTATDGERVFAPMNDRAATPDVPLSGPGLHALDLETGKVLWSRKAEGDCSGDRKAALCRVRNATRATRRRRSSSTARSFKVPSTASCACSTPRPARRSGRYDTMRKFDTVNGVPGNGGSIDSSPYVAANGTLFVVSGYARFGETPGNVLLAFRPKRP